MSTQVEPPVSPPSAKAQATPTAPPPLEFEKLHPAVYVYRPDASASRKAKPPISDSALQPLSLSSSKATPAPRTVLICGWMNASLRHVSKYASPWSLLLPQATIIVLLSRGGDYFTSSEARAEPLKKILGLLQEEKKREDKRIQLGRMAASLDRAAISMSKDVQESEAADGGTKGKEEDEKTLNEEMAKVDQGMVVHTFSDGGSGNVSLLLSMLKRQTSSSSSAGAGDDLSPIPQVNATLFDCSPSKMSPTSGSIAFTLPLMAQRRYLLAHTTRVLLFVLLFVGKWIKKLLGRSTMSEVMRRRLNDSTSWSATQAASASAVKTTTTKATTKGSFPPRLYLYSEADPLIPFKDVEAHARDLVLISNPNAPSPEPIEVERLPSGGGGKELAKRVREQKGDVVLCRWQKADHCAIGRHDFEGYWTAVRTFLEQRL